MGNKRVRKPKQSGERPVQMSEAEFDYWKRDADSAENITARLSRMPAFIEQPGDAVLPELRTPHSAFYVFGECRVFLSIHPQNGYTLSLKRLDRFPSWDEIMHARYALIPSQPGQAFDMAIVVPEKEAYLEVQKLGYVLTFVQLRRNQSV